MKSLSKFIIILLLASISSSKLNAQSAEIKTIDSLINHYKEKKLNERIDYWVFKNLKIYDNPANIPAILKHLDSCRKDSIPMVRYMAYNIIFVFLRNSKNVETAKTTLNYLLEGCSDKNSIVSGSNKSYFCGYRSLFAKEFFDDIKIQKAILELAKKDIEGYRGCIADLITKDDSRKMLLDFAKEHYTPLGKKYNSEYEKGTFYYRTVEWRTLIVLGSKGDKNAIALIIKRIEEINDYKDKLSFIDGVSSVVGGREMANLFYKYYMDDRGLQKTPDGPQRGGGIEYGHYLNFEWLHPQNGLFLNPLTKEEEREVVEIRDRKYDKTNENERNKREMDYILFFRKWLTKNKPNWKILNEN